MVSLTLIDILLLLVSASLFIFAFTPIKLKVSEEFMRLSERNKGPGIPHGMIRREDKKGLVADRCFSAPAQTSE